MKKCESLEEIIELQKQSLIQTINEINNKEKKRNNLLFSSSSSLQIPSSSTFPTSTLAIKQRNKNELIERIERERKEEKERINNLYNDLNYYNNKRKEEKERQERQQQQQADRRQDHQQQDQGQNQEEEDNFLIQRNKNRNLSKFSSFLSSSMLNESKKTSEPTQHLFYKEEYNKMYSIDKEMQKKRSERFDEYGEKKKVNLFFILSLLFSLLFSLLSLLLLSCSLTSFLISFSS